MQDLKPSTTPLPPGPGPAATPPQAARLPLGRLESLDVFRGATMAAMILVNNPGSWSAVYKPLLHAEWHGWTFTDLVFPFFLWIVGVAIPLSLCRKLDAGEPPRTLALHALRRTAILFGLGLFLNSFGYLIDVSQWREGVGAWLSHYLTNIRIPGVLQRIALCYFVSALLVLRSTVRIQAAVLIGCLLSYWLMIAFIPVPGYGSGLLNKEHNLAQYIDNAVLNGPVIGTHVWKTSKTWDPEGIFSTIPAVATCLFGVMAGHLLRSPINPQRKVIRLLLSGAVLILIGLLMHRLLPINKNLWTSSYSVFMAGMAAVIFAVCYWLIDLNGWRRWSYPFKVFGMNAITVFVLSGILGRLIIQFKTPSGKTWKGWLYDGFFTPLASPINASLLWACANVALFFLLAWLMYRRRWFVRF